jgi:hypothetical protein
MLQNGIAAIMYQQSLMVFVGACACLKIPLAALGNDLEKSPLGETCTTAAEYSGKEERVIAADCNEDSL